MAASVPLNELALHSVSVYGDLNEKGYWRNVRILRGLNGEPGSVYFTAYNVVEKKEEAIVPLNYSEDISISWLEQMFSSLRYNFPEHLNRLTLAIVGSDSSVVYYTVSSDMTPPTNASLSMKHR